MEVQNLPAIDSKGTYDLEFSNVTSIINLKSYGFMG
jgi:hypothetical protein